MTDFKLQIADCKLQISLRRGGGRRVLLQSAILNLQSAILNLQFAICNLQLPICNSPHG
jgi:hypothetical protein